MQRWLRRSRLRYICISKRFSIFCSAYVWAEDTLAPVMFITAQRQLQSENVRLAEGNPFTSLPLGLTVGCLIQDIDSQPLLPGPKITYWFTLLTVVSWKLNHCDLHCHIKYIVLWRRLVVFPLLSEPLLPLSQTQKNQYSQDSGPLLLTEETLETTFWKTGHIIKPFPGMAG